MKSHIYPITGVTLVTVEPSIENYTVEACLYFNYCVNHAIDYYLIDINMSVDIGEFYAL